MAKKRKGSRARAGRRPDGTFKVGSKAAREAGRKGAAARKARRKR